MKCLSGLMHSPKKAYEPAIRFSSYRVNYNLRKKLGISAGKNRLVSFFRVMFQQKKRQSQGVLMKSASNKQSS